MKKFIVFAVLSVIAVWTMEIFSFYLYNYPARNPVSEVLRDIIDWKEIFPVYLALFALPLVLALVKYKHFNYAKKFCIILVTCNILYLAVCIDNVVPSYIQNSKEFSDLLNDYTKLAAADIKKDKVKTFGFGMPLAPKGKNEQIRQNAVDSVYRKYGILRASAGCTISPMVIQAVERYDEITSKYLEERNGKNWRIKMEKELDKY